MTGSCWSKILKIFASNQQEVVIRAKSVLIPHDLLGPSVNWPMEFKY